MENSQLQNNSEQKKKGYNWKLIIPIIFLSYFLSEWSGRLFYTQDIVGYGDMAVYELLPPISMSLLLGIFIFKYSNNKRVKSVIIAAVLFSILIIIDDFFEEKMFERIDKLLLFFWSTLITLVGAFIITMIGAGIAKISEPKEKKLKLSISKKALLYSIFLTIIALIITMIWHREELIIVIFNPIGILFNPNYLSGFFGIAPIISTFIYIFIIVLIILKIVKSIGKATTNLKKVLLGLLLLIPVGIHVFVMLFLLYVLAIAGM